MLYMGRENKLEISFVRSVQTQPRSFPQEGPGLGLAKARPCLFGEPIIWLGNALDLKLNFTDNEFV